MHRYSLNLKQRSVRQKAKEDIARRDGLCCFYCQLIFDAQRLPTIEYLLSRKHGGNSHLSNLVMACDGCNRHVGAWPLVYKIMFREAFL